MLLLCACATAPVGHLAFRAHHKGPQGAASCTHVWSCCCSALPVSIFHIPSSLARAGPRGAGVPPHRPPHPPYDPVRLDAQHPGARLCRRTRAGFLPAVCRPPTCPLPVPNSLPACCRRQRGQRFALSTLPLLTLRFSLPCRSSPGCSATMGSTHRSRWPSLLRAPHWPSQVGRLEHASSPISPCPGMQAAAMHSTCTHAAVLPACNPPAACRDPCPPTAPLAACSDSPPPATPAPLADVPLRKAVAGARVGLLPGRGFVVNPTVEEQVSLGWPHSVGSCSLAAASRGAAARCDWQGRYAHAPPWPLQGGWLGAACAAFPA